MTDNKCNWMLVAGYNAGGSRLYVCSGNYQWQSFDVTSKSIDQANSGTTVGINFMQTC